MSERWTQLLPEWGAAPAGFTDLGKRSRRLTVQHRPMPVDVGSVPIDEALAWVQRPRLGVQARQVREWPADMRRCLAFQLHVDAVRNDGPPDDGPAAVMPRLIGDGMCWSRSELAWALRVANEWGHYDGAAFLLPGHMAASMTGDELAGFGPALQAVFDTFLTERRMPGATRWQLAALYGTALGRLAGGLPPHLLHAGDRFGPFVRRRLGDRLDPPDVTLMLSHAAALTRRVPSGAWLREAAGLPITGPGRDVLECLVGFAGRLHDDNDRQLRGLTWIVSQDTAAETTDLLRRVATNSDAVPARRTAAAAVEILANRPMHK